MADISGLGSSGTTHVGRGLERIQSRLDVEERTSFADTLRTALGEVSELQQDAQDAIGAFLRGEPIEIHEVMAAAEEAGIALEMLIGIRNKLTEAYRTVSQMQQ